MGLRGGGQYKDKKQVGRNPEGGKKRIPQNISNEFRGGFGSAKKKKQGG